MTYDLVIRNGTVVDGSGLARYRADVAIKGDRIVRIGRIKEKANSEIDAEGHVVSPGFIDGHAHMDAQVFWDSLGSCSCWHGVTSVVMGNCGFTLAPSRPSERDHVITHLEMAEDIPRAAIEQGIEWTWESFPEYMDAVEAQPKAINYATQIGHSALRTYTMRDRAYTEQANEDDLSAMEQILREAIRAGALGFTTTRQAGRVTADGRPLSSTIANWEECRRLVAVLGEEGSGVFELAPETSSVDSDDPAVAKEFYDRLKELAIATRVPVTFGVRRKHLELQLDSFALASKGGGQMFGQTRSEAHRVNGGIFSFKASMPFDKLPAWQDIRSRPFDEQTKLLHDPDIRKQLVDAVAAVYPDRRLPKFESFYAMRDNGGNKSIADLAAERGSTPVEVILDLALETDLAQVFDGVGDASEDYDVSYAMKDPHTVLSFSDSGAHLRYHLGPSIYTAMFSHWVRDKQEFSLEEAVQMVTLVPSLAWKLGDRGMIREGMIADINVFDPETIALATPTIETDLPTGAPRVVQKAHGFLSTIVSGKETFRNNEHTGTHPGQLIRGPLANANH